MAKTMKKVDVVTVGMGLTGGIIAAECGKAGLSVVALERGHDQTVQDFQEMHDEWRYAINYGMMQDLSKETITFRHDRGMRALPMRKMGSFLLGSNLGGAGVHWNGMMFRFFPYDFEIKSMTEKRYGKNKLSKDYLLQDWGVTYKEMEPYFKTFEDVIGVAGKRVSKFEAERSGPYPMPPLPTTPVLEKFITATKELKYEGHVLPASNASVPYTNPDGEKLNACQFCAYCERFGCEYNAKGSPINTVIPTAEKTGKCEIRCNANVVEILKKGDKVTGVKYINTLTMEEIIQPADVVVLTSYVLNNAKLLMVSNIGEMYNPETGKGTLGKNYCYQIGPGVSGFFEEQMNLYAGAGALGAGIHEFNADNFDHSKLDFIHGGLISMLQTGKRPIGTNPVKPGTPSWGAEFKKASIYNFARTLGIGAQGASMPHKENYLTLDSVYKDAYGLPLLQMTYNFTPQDRALYTYLREKMVGIMKQMGAKTVAPSGDIKDYSLLPYQSTHNTGGTIMGVDPKDSVVNTHLQHWDVDNLFVVGAGNFPHNGGFNPTATVGALAYKCAEGIIKYSKKGGSLVK